MMNGIDDSVGDTNLSRTKSLIRYEWLRLRWNASHLSSFILRSRLHFSIAHHPNWQRTSNKGFFRQCYFFFVVVVLHLFSITFSFSCSIMAHSNRINWFLFFIHLSFWLWLCFCFCSVLFSLLLIVSTFFIVFACICV